MRVSKFIHSCVLVEKDGGSILFDPGKFTFVEKRAQPQQFTGLSGIILTHGHPDHVDTEALAEILKVNPAASVYGNGETARILGEKKIPVTLFEDGSREVGPFRVRAIEAEHAPIVGPEAPRNTAYALDGELLNPGDSFSEVLDEFQGIAGVLVPVMAPWAKELEMVAFVDRLRPKLVIPVHDGQAKDFFLHLRYSTFEQEFGKSGIRFATLYGVGDSVEI